MNRLTMFAGIAVLAIASEAATTVTYSDDYGVTWTSEVVSGTNVKLTQRSVANNFSFDAANTPWTFTVGGTEYNVTQIATLFANWQGLNGIMAIPDAIAEVPFGAFKVTGLKHIIIPANVTAVRDQAFNNNTKMEAIWIKGAVAGTTLYANYTFGTSPKLKTVLIGPTVKSNGNNSGGTLDNQSCAATLFAPAGKQWERATGASTAGKTYYGARENYNILLYGAGQDIDISIDETASTLTATVATEHALTNVLASAVNFKQYFGLDTKVVMTKEIEIAGTGLTAELVESASAEFGALRFAVRTQAQADNIFAIFPGTTPIVFDTTGATENIDIATATRKVYILLPENGEYRVRKTGTIVSIH